MRRPFSISSPDFVSLADWIGSDRRWFEFVGQLNEDYYIALAKSRAANALAEIGLDVARQRMGKETPATFKKLTTFEQPQPQQAAMASLPVDEKLVILEAETGSGKTEAALWHFVKLYEATKVDELYFAVPTKAAAKQLQRRVHDAARHLFGKEAPETVLAASGYLFAGEHEGQKLPNWEVLWDDATKGTGNETELIARRWAAEYSKRFLAAQFAVGTVDQAMLGALPVKHAHLRASSLARNLLIIDEIHASDTWMTKIQQRLVSDHMAVGGYVLGMSATLGSKARIAWLGAKHKPTLAEACATPYPAIWTKGREEPFWSAQPQAAGKKVRVTLQELGDDPAHLAEAIVEKARAGAKLLVIRNLVDDAVKLFEAVEALLSSDERHLLFSVNGITTLHHSRFAAEDRALLDARAEELFGKPKPDQASQRPAHGMILIGTQTLEISVDLCADFMISDLCPVDVLLQRIGRLHRHNNPRPAGFDESQCLVLVPEGGLAPCMKKMKHGLGAWTEKDGTLAGIYMDVPVLELTRRLIEHYPVWDIPRMNRMLVESATHEAAIGALKEELGKEWLQFGRSLQGGELSRAMLAGLTTLKREQYFTDLRFPDIEETVRTRLGEEGRKIAFPEGTIGPFAKPISELALPAHWSREIGFEEQPEILERKDGGLISSLKNGGSFMRRTGCNGPQKTKSERPCTIFSPIPLFAYAPMEESLKSCPCPLCWHRWREMTSPRFRASGRIRRRRWHMFLVQLAALALQRAGEKDLSKDADRWAELLRGLTPDYLADEPWHLIVEDRTKPAFMQPNEPEGIKYTGVITAADQLDMLITAKNHDLKQAIAEMAELDEWAFALVSLQTSEGFNGSGNYGIARMNGGSSSRVCMSVTPLLDGSGTATPGLRWRWEVAKLNSYAGKRLREWSSLDYPAERGRSLLWLSPWPRGKSAAVRRTRHLVHRNLPRVRLLSGWKADHRAGRHVESCPHRRKIGEWRRRRSLGAGQP